MGFSLGGSKSKSSSEQASLSYGYSGSQSESDARQSSLGTSRSTSFGVSGQDLAFKDLFARLYSGASATAGAISGDPVKSAADMLFSGGMGFLDQLQGGAAGDYLQQRVAGGSPLLDEQIGALGEDLGRFYREELNPALTSEAVGGGALGGGRQGVAQGRAAAAVAQEFQRGATALRSGDIAARDAAARDLMAQRTGAAGVGLSSLSGLLGLSQAGNMANLAPFQALSAILGGPTVLTQAESGSLAESLSTSEAVSRAIAESFGEDFSASYGKSTSKSKSGSIGF